MFHGNEDAQVSHWLNDARNRPQKRADRRARSGRRVLSAPRTCRGQQGSGRARRGCRVVIRKGNVALRGRHMPASPSGCSVRGVSAQKGLSWALRPCVLSYLRVMHQDRV